MDESIAWRQRLSAERCLVLEDVAKEPLFELLIDALAAAPEAGDKTLLGNGIRQRERLLSTGIGLGIAIPHVRIPSVKDLIMAAALVRNGVEGYETLDSVPVKLVVMIAARTDQQELYLRVLSFLSIRLRDESFRNRLFLCRDNEELYRALGEC